MKLAPCRVYLAGPMRGLQDDNYPAFDKAAEELRRLGFRVFNPADNQAGNTFAEYMAIDLPAVCRSDAVVVLPGWRRSQGSRLELMVATEIGLPIAAYPALYIINPNLEIIED